MKLLYKYYSNESKYAFENVENGNICFTPLESLNDPFEGVGAYLFPISDEEQEYWDSIGSDLPKNLAKRISEDVRDSINFNYRIFCCTREYNNPLLWAYYANSHKGFCVAYEESSILEVSDELLDIKYRSEMFQINENSEETFKNLLSIKSSDWSNEKECRALYKLKSNEISYLSPDVYWDAKKQSDKNLYKLRGHVQTKNLKTLCSEKFICKKCKPLEIYLGMKMNVSDRRRLINIANKLGIKIYQMYQEQNSFKMISKEI
ncbi:DUF2971 domain-containing protein [Intestinibacter sp.]